MGKAIDVVWKRGGGGEIRPVSFDWEEIRYTVDSVGRRWKADDGEHILVMVQPNDRVVELLFINEDGSWEIIKREKRLGLGKV